MTIIGIDPGTAKMGYGVIEYEKPETEFIDCGIFNTTTDAEKHLRLKDLHKNLTSLIEKHNPDVWAVEDIFYFKNKKTLVDVSRAQGIALLAAAEKGKECHIFTPLQVKQAVTGYGQAQKEQVKYMVKNILNLNEEPSSPDAADALAVAICCAHSLDLLRNIENNG